MSAAPLRGGDDNAQCHAFYGPFSSVIVLPPDCQSPVGLCSHFLYAFDERFGGAPLWLSTVIGQTGISVANGLVYGGNDNGFFALDASTGNQLWSYATSMRMATPFVVNGTLYTTCNSSDVCAFALA